MMEMRQNIFESTLENLRVIISTSQVDRWIQAGELKAQIYFYNYATQQAQLLLGDVPLLHL